MLTLVSADFGKNFCQFRFGGKPMPVNTIEWTGELDGRVRMVDQRLLPERFEQMHCDTAQEMWDAIKTLAVRGAPALGVAGAMALVLAVRDSDAADGSRFLADVEKACDYIGSSRPTAVNLFWALDRMKRLAAGLRDREPQEIKAALLAEAKVVLEEDNATCRAIGEHGASLILDGDCVLTHCNAGGLATGRYGTALSVLFAAHEQGRRFRVYADETRPLLQGARITAWELMNAGIDVTVICDNAAAWIMKTAPVTRVVVGADRIAANGDAANKIGTYGLALLAGAHRVPFYIAAPLSTFDLALPDGDAIPIEERDAAEVVEPFGRRTAPAGAKAGNPAFDVTPAGLITAFITEAGVVEKPDRDKLAALPFKA
jgi:methylthioribose-1-phosphate isomerase